MKAALALEDGAIFEGTAFGATGESAGEVVFNTSMTGYQEILTDPSYKGQIVAMTYPLIGNYGINTEDFESAKPHLSGFVVREASRIVSNWRASMSLGDFLKKNKIIGIEGIDTRALTLHIRSAGAMKGIISTKDLDPQSLVRKAKESPGLVGIDLVKEVSCKKVYEWNDKGKYRVVLLDCGAKHNIMRDLAARGCQVTVVPAKTSAKKILALKPDGVMLSNGPGDPAAVTYVIETVKKLIGKVPIFGICLGHQMLGLALGGKTYKLKFGHRGANQPVMDLRTRKVEITSQNHGFCVDLDSLKDKAVELTHLNLNDQTSEGLRHKKYPVFSVQYHPEASAGPHDSKYLFDEFIKSLTRK
ncbi:MAG: glutamine-hydrolyzing carbamoyl-phosphate synthase small subunit [Candidatus Margulisiibacteriota bacterium]